VVSVSVVEGFPFVISDQLMVN